MTITLSPEEYATAYRLITATAKHPENITEVVKTRLLDQLGNKPTLLDVGAGNCAVARRLASFFSRMVLLEPNPNQVAGFDHPRATVLSESLQGFESTEQFDLVLLSHVLYHVPRAEWPGFVERLMSFVRPGGYALIVMAAAHGQEYELCQSFSDTWAGDTTELYAELQVTNLEYEVLATTSGFSTTTLAEMETVCRFLVLEECYTAAQLDRLGSVRAQQLDADIRSHAKRYRKPDGTYRLNQDEDFVIIRRPGASSPAEPGRKRR
ncbi:MAG: class I SAM-dependent methyltransferase [Mycolicibacterium sp.]|uniref:class I SAM-dependent methyltransferase n=1 Tax=Mycolicibacterium sp. TaxID=2320850 RepID=UPI003D10683D